MCIGTQSVALLNRTAHTLCPASCWCQNGGLSFDCIVKGWNDTSLSRNLLLLVAGLTGALETACVCSLLHFIPAAPAVAAVRLTQCADLSRVLAT